MGETVLDILPALAIPTSTSTNAVCFTKGPKWLFTGGDDGFVRKFNLISSLKGQAPLTVAQRHQIVDSITLGAVVEGFWENEVPQRQAEVLASQPNSSETKKANGILYTPKISPVYSLACDSQGIWLLSGLDNGGIAMQSSRMNEGDIQWYFRDKECSNQYQGDSHSQTVSCLCLDRDETSFISGSWDQTCLYWDLNTGKTKGKFSTMGQVSSIEWRPIGAENVSVETAVGDTKGGKEGEKETKVNEEDEEDMDSLFGSGDEEEEQGADDANGAKANQPSAIATTRVVESATSFLTSTINGAINVWDTREPGRGVIEVGRTGEPWCMSATWSMDGNSVWVGRRRGVVEQWDIRKVQQDPLNTLRLPTASGCVSSVSRVGSRYLLLGGEDNVRLYDLSHDADASTKKVPFLTIPSHGGGLISNLGLDATGQFLVCACGGRGWGRGGDHVFLYEMLYG